MLKKILAALAALMLFFALPTPAQAATSSAATSSAATPQETHQLTPEYADGFLNVAGLHSEEEILDALDERLFALAGKQSPKVMDYLHSLDYSTALVADDGSVLSVVVMVTDEPENTGQLAPMAIWWVAPGCNNKMCLIAARP